MTFEEIAAPMATPPGFRALGWHRSTQPPHFLTPNPTKRHVYRRQARPTPTWRQSGFVIGFSLFTKTHQTRPPAQAATAERNGLFPAGPTRPERLISYPCTSHGRRWCDFLFFYYFCEARMLLCQHFVVATRSTLAIGAGGRNRCSGAWCQSQRGCGAWRAVFGDLGRSSMCFVVHILCLFWPGHCCLCQAVVTSRCFNGLNLSPVLWQSGCRP